MQQLLVPKETRKPEKKKERISSPHFSVGFARKSGILSACYK